LQEPFQIIIDSHGKFNSLVFNYEEPEWSLNMKRGIATYLQMDTSQVNLEELKTFQDTEVTNSMFLFLIYTFAVFFTLLDA